MNFIKTIFGAESTQYESTLERMKRVTHDASAVIAKAMTGFIVATAAAIIKIVSSSITYFDNLQHKAEQLGQSVSFIAAFEAAFRQAGGSIQQADKAISDFSRKWGEAQTGAGELITVLDILDISTKNLDGTSRTAKEGMFLFADAINKTKDPAEKLFLATKAFGEEGGVKMIEVLDGGADSMARLIAQFELANPEIDQHAKSLSEAKENLAALWDAVLLFGGRFSGKIMEMFVTDPEIALANFKNFAMDMLYEMMAATATIIDKVTFGAAKAEEQLGEMRRRLDENAQNRVQIAIESAEEREEKENAITQSIVEQSDAFKKQLEELAKLRKDEALRTGQVADRNKEIIHALIEQGLTLDTIANRYPNLKEAIEASKTEYEKAAEAAAKIAENVDKATDATRDLADEAGKVDYGPGPGGAGGSGGSGGSGGNGPPPPRNMGSFDPSTGGAPALGDQGSVPTGSGVTGIFAGQYEDLSSMSVAELLKIADELEQQFKEIRKNVSNSGVTGPTGGLGLDKIYADTIKQILDNINKELYYRAKEEAGSKGGLIPTAGFMSPEKYFEKLDDFIEKLYEKETEKDSMFDKQKKSAETQVEATKKLQNALERFSSSLERSQSSRFGVSLRP